MSTDPSTRSGWRALPAGSPGTRLGRYETLCEIGAGGMASVFLGRLRGPGGFHKWVALKRVHENLAKEEEFVLMFLDEARIAASLQHPNVAQVFDLGESDGRYFLAMEYLHGEPLHRVLHRSADRTGGPLPPRLAAHVTAEVAVGLHHAHEARDPGGRPLRLVHRDVTPHNVFVTYDGLVKLTDFGVARAAGRLTSSVSGTLKGKLPYAPPELLRGDSLDRRADIFALGVILWESCTGRRLFKGRTDSETLQRIHDGYRVSPRSFVPAFPAALEAILERALAYDRADRYPDAAELARDLSAVVQAEPGPASQDALRELMESRFAADRAEKDDLLLQAASAGPPLVVPASAPPEATSVTAAPLPPRAEGRRVPILLAVGAPALLATLAGIAFAFGFSDPERTATGPSVEGPASAEIRSTPPGARVEVDGEPVEGRTPLRLDALEPGPHELRLSLEGYVPQVERFDVEARERLRVSYALAPAAPPAPSEQAPAEAEAPGPAGRAEEGPAEVAPEATTSGPARTDDPPASRAVRGRGRLTLITSPWARIWINGVDRGRTPLFEAVVPAGRLRVRLQPEGQGPARTFAFRLRPGQTLSRNLRL